MIMMMIMTMMVIMMMIEDKEGEVVYFRNTQIKALNEYHNLLCYVHISIT